MIYIIYSVLNFVHFLYIFLLSLYFSQKGAFFRLKWFVNSPLFTTIVCQNLSKKYLYLRYLVKIRAFLIKNPHDKISWGFLNYTYSFFFSILNNIIQFPGPLHTNPQTHLLFLQNVLEHKAVFLHQLLPFLYKVQLFQHFLYF